MNVTILGNGRSGSSMLGLMLGSHSEVINVGEAYHLDEDFVSPQKRKRIKEEGLCGVCGKGCPVWEDRGKTFSEKDIIIDTSKFVSWAKRHKKFIRTTRSIYDRLGSFKHKKGVITKEIVRNHVKREKEISGFLRDKEAQVEVVKYEDLCSSIVGLANAFWYIGLNPTKLEVDKYHRFWETMQHPIRGNSITNMLVKLYHGLMQEKDLSPKQREFMDKVGFNVIYLDRTKYLDKSDLKLIKRFGGAKIDKELGY